MLYIGSCRYMADYPWDYFPGKLHSTREIIFFLENINHCKKIIDNNPSELSNFIFGDIFHPNTFVQATQFINNLSPSFVNKSINQNLNKIIIEISSRKVRMYNNIPLSHHYSRFDTKHCLTEIILTDQEIECDIKCIINLCKIVFNENIQIHIIPHCNLKIMKTVQYIVERNNLVNLLEVLCSKYNINFHNVGKYIENNHENAFLDVYMNDSAHYSKDYDKIKSFVIREIVKN